MTTLKSNAIVAQCTPSGSGAIALVRISGPDAVAIANECSQLSSKAAINQVMTHTINHGWVIDLQGKKIDEVLFLVMHGPRTFTGENTVEITCHNNQFLINAIIERIIACGARPAQAGEFTRSAVENNKIDLLQAEAINELIHANSQQALKHALGQLEGTLSHHIETLEKQLLHLMVLCEASFEFLEEDVNFAPSMQKLFIQTLEKTIALQVSFDQQKILRSGIRIALLGTVNAGKSSLFNALVGKKRAIVTPIAGTTRDVIESGLYLNGSYLTFIDTAGLRSTEDVIEKEGIERSLQEAQLADIILLVCDGSRSLIPAEHDLYQQLLIEHAHKIILVITKNDLPQVSVVLVNGSTLQQPQALARASNVQPQQELSTLRFAQKVHVSTQTQSGINDLKQLLEKRIQELFETTNCPFLLSKRQIDLLTTFQHKLLEVQTVLFDDNIEYEIVSHHLKEAITLLSELTGKSVSEKAMDMIFREFCVGK